MKKISLKRFSRLSWGMGMLVVLIMTGSCTTVKKGQIVNDNVQPVLTTPLSPNDSKRFSYFFLEAERQQLLGNYTAAYDLLQHCLDINPDAAEVHFALASYHSEMNENNAMLSAMEKAAALRPDNDMYLETLAQAYVKTHDYDKATEAFERLAHNNPMRVDVLSMLLSLYQVTGKQDKMIKTLDRMETIEGSNEDITLSKMQVYSMLGDKKQEFNELKSLARQHPNDYKYRVMMGNWLLKNGKEKEALEEYNAVLKKEPDNIMAQLSMMDYYRAQHQDSLAKAQMESLLVSPHTENESKLLLMRQFVSEIESSGGDSTEVLNLFNKILSQPQPNADMAQLAAAYKSLKKMPDSVLVKAHEKVLELEPDNVGSRLELLQMAWHDEDFNRVVSLSKPGVEYRPDNIWFYYFLGLAYFRQDKSDLALSTFQKGVAQVNEESSKDIVSDFYAIIGDILHEKGLNGKAYEAYDSCLQWKPDNISCLNNYAYYLSVENKDLAKAEQMSYRTVKAEPDNSTYLDTYAWILFKQQRFAEAKIYIDQALAADSTVSDVIIEHAGDIYMMNGNTEEALSFWKKALQQGEGSKALLQKKIRLKKYIDEEEK